MSLTVVICRKISTSFIPLHTNKCNCKTPKPTSVPTQRLQSDPTGYSNLSIWYSFLQWDPNLCLPTDILSFRDGKLRSEKDFLLVQQVFISRYPSLYCVVKVHCSLFNSKSKWGIHTQISLLPGPGETELQQSHFCQATRLSSWIQCTRLIHNSVSGCYFPTC